MKRFFIAVLFSTAFFAVQAQFRYGRTVTIDKPVYEDLYITGGNVIIKHPFMVTTL
jgi:hypothetical protein